MAIKTITPGPRGCEDLKATGFDPVATGGLVMRGLDESGSFREGIFHFADDKPGQPPATLKVNADYLTSDPAWGPVIVGVYAEFPCLKSADVITYVPDGPRDFATALGHAVGKPVAYARRIPGGGKHDYEFETDKDRQLIGGALRPFMIEDITSTLSSPAALRRMIAAAQAEVRGVSVEEAYTIPVHLLSMLLRGSVNPKYTRGLVPHFLAERLLSRDAREFKKHYPNIVPVKES